MKCAKCAIDESRVSWYARRLDGRTMNERMTNDERTSGAGITEELREWIGYMPDCYPSALDRKNTVTAIADRIDAEHEKAVRELNNLADASVLLPVDADGVPIHVGDEVKLEHNGRVTTVTNINYNEYGWQVYCAEGGGFDKDTRCRHFQPDSWERIIEDAIAEGFERTDVSAPCEVSNDELVERCRRLAGGDA